MERGRLSGARCDAVPVSRVNCSQSEPSISSLAIYQLRVVFCRSESARPRRRRSCIPSECPLNSRSAAIRTPKVSNKRAYHSPAISYQTSLAPQVEVHLPFALRLGGYPLPLRLQLLSDCRLLIVFSAFRCFRRGSDAHP